MADNLSKFKKRIRPKDYENGPVKIFTKEEIDEWTAKNYDNYIGILERQKGLTDSDLRFLDSLKLSQAEMQFAELMEGTQESFEGGANGES